MDKTSKSVRLDNEILELIDRYCSFLKDVFGSSVSFSNIVTSGLLQYMESETGKYEDIMEKGSIVATLPNGKLKKLDFSDEEIKRISDLHDEARELMLNDLFE